MLSYIFVIVCGLFEWCAGSLMFVYICIDVGDPVEGRVGMPLTGSLLFVYTCICIDVGDPVEGRFWNAINR